MKKTLRAINETFSKEKLSSKIPSIFYHNAVDQLTNPTEIVNTFNLRFANIGENLAIKIKRNIIIDGDFKSTLLLQA